jgi:hypothetical protein
MPAPLIDRFMATCPTCGQSMTDWDADNLRVRLGGHHYYAHSVRLTEAEVADLVDEVITEKDLARLEEEAARAEHAKTEELPL